jgi:transcription-repair coupling factor (superfamily II helicase)
MARESILRIALLAALASLHGSARVPRAPLRLRSALWPRHAPIRAAATGRKKAASTPPVAEEPLAAAAAAEPAEEGTQSPELSGEELNRPKSASGLRRRVIKRGDYVVHRDLGIARFRGVLNVEATSRRYLVLEFQNEEVELPTSQQHVLTLYRRADEAMLKPVKLTSTGRLSSWTAKKARAKKSLEQLTVGILESYRDRARLSRRPCPPDGPLFAQFAANCTFTLTDDQRVACEEVAHDMTERAQPMDRLLCGDVGFGKTEVAMRAIFRMASSGRQAAILAPTTVLAWQHHATMRARMPTMRVGLLTRLTPPKRARALLDMLAAGEIDVMIGTHSLLSKRVTFKELGLMVVDEEHRFGVAQKDKVKALASHVDYLTMSATPIPRTLSLGLSALRDMSILNTSPPGRLPVRTVCEPFSTRLVERALRTELERGGQVFFVVPRIANIVQTLTLLDELFPDLAVEWAHGQCTDLETRMMRFANGTASVLVSTSVVECGIDMPHVNTLIVQHAHMFGLASLHQLRGRVGRSSAQAYAYLLAAEAHTLTPEASARLKALQQFSALGDGFELAQADMALRGCGNLLGPEQSGQINDVGAEFFFEMLEEAIETARRQAAVDEALKRVQAGAG